jgi:integration host factor subunit alpha
MNHAIAHPNADSSAHDPGARGTPPTTGQVAAADTEVLSFEPVSFGPAFTLTKAELSEMLFERVGLNKREAKDMVETFFEEIRDALVRGESVKLSGFGNFQLRDKPQRPGRNPKTGEAIPISARRVVTFHASQKLKAQIEVGGGSGV